MMEGEDVFAKYHREWKLSDERRYIIKKTEAKMKEDAKARTKA